MSIFIEIQIAKIILILFQLSIDIIYCLCYYKINKTKGGRTYQERTATNKRRYKDMKDYTRFMKWAVIKIIQTFNKMYGWLKQKDRLGNQRSATILMVAFFAFGLVAYFFKNPVQRVRFAENLNLDRA